MKLKLIKADIEQRKATRQNLEHCLSFLKQNRNENKEVIYFLSQELFAIKDQLAKYKIVHDLLEDEEEEENGEMLKKY